MKLVNLHFAFLVLSLSGCASVVSYAPNAENVKMGEVQAKRILDQSHIKIIDNKSVKLTNLIVGRMGINSWGHEVTLPLKDLRVSAGVESAMYNALPILILPDSGEDRIKVSSRHSEIKVAEALYVISMKAKREGYLPQEAIEEERFEQAVQTYQTAKPKPTISEGARAFKVRADEAVRKKLPDEAADFYGEALKIDPWWPEGHFNRGLLLGETEMYSGAILEMKRYLRLVPNAPNARIVQDKMYLWQGKEN